MPENAADILPDNSRFSDLSILYRTASGTVTCPANHFPNADELQIAMFLADAGFTVAFRQPSEAHGQKTSDAWVFETSWQAWEFKTITSETVNIRNRAQTSLLNGRKQAGTVLLWLNRPFHSEAEDIRELNRALPQVVIHDKKRELSRIVLMNRSGKIQTVILKDVEDGKRFSQF